jgi:hypothetical protein
MYLCFTFNKCTFAFQYYTMPLKYLILFILSFSFSAIYAQDHMDCNKVLDQEPYFVRHKSNEKDSLLLRDIQILKHCGNLEAADSVFLKGPMLGALMLDQVRLGKPATYRTLIEYFAAFKNTIAYQDFVKGLKLYQAMALKKVNPATWETDKELFVKIGFTVNDLADFKQFITEPAQANITYREALSRYMSSMEAIRIDK